MPAATVKAIAYADEVASLGNTSGSDTAATASAGDDTDAARSDHVHKIGSGSVGATIKLASGVIDFQAVPVVAPGATALVAGDLYLDSGVLKVCTVSYSA